MSDTPDHAAAHHAALTSKAPSGGKIAAKRTRNEFLQDSAAESATKEEYEPNYIEGMHTEDDGAQFYLMKWKGFGDEAASMEETSKVESDMAFEGVLTVYKLRHTTLPQGDPTTVEQCGVKLTNSKKGNAVKPAEKRGKFGDCESDSRTTTSNHSRQSKSQSREAQSGTYGVKAAAAMGAAAASSSKSCRLQCTKTLEFCVKQKPPKGVFDRPGLRGESVC
jgi:hypothetical protein